MQILAFVQSLLPKFGKDRLQEDINICRTELQNITIPSYTNAANVFDKPASKELQAFEKQWGSLIKVRAKGNMIASIKVKLEEVETTLGLIEKYTDSEFETEVVVAGMTVLKGTLVRMVEIADFVSTYALRFLNYAYISETTAVNGKPGAVGSDLSPAEIKLIKTHFIEFCIALNALSRPEKETEKLLTAIPEVLVNARGEAALKVFGEAKVDPLGVFQVKGFTGNPIYRVGMIVAEIQANRYKRAKDLKTVLELRMLDLQQSRSGQSDPALEREIDVIQSRIDSLDEKIRRAEESVQ